MVSVQGQVLPKVGQLSPPPAQAGISATLGLGRNTEVLNSQMHARFFYLTYAGQVYSICNQAVATLSTLSTTYTGLLVINPFGSGFNAVLLQCSVALASAPAGISTIGHQGITTIQKTAVTNGTPTTVYCGLLGGAAGACTGSVAATLPTAPIQIRSIGCGVNATGSATTIPFALDEIDGSIILQPGTYLGLGYVTTAPAVIASYHWAELPI
jgi:hypothetical protein